MKKNVKRILTVSLFAMSAMSALADDGNSIYVFYNSTPTTKWSSTTAGQGKGWTHFDFNGDTYVKKSDGDLPNSSAVEVYFQYGSSGICVDGTYKVASIFSNPDVAYSTGGEYLVDMSQGGTLNLDGDNYTQHYYNFNNSFYYISPFAAADYYNALYFEIGNKKSGSLDHDRSIVFNGGTMNITDSTVATNGNNRTTVFAMLRNYDLASSTNLTFQNGNVLNVENDLLLVGGRGVDKTVNSTTYFNFNNTTTIGNVESGTYKDVYVADRSTYTNNNGGNFAVVTNVGGTFKANNMYVRPNAHVSVNEGASLNLANGLYLSYGDNAVDGKVNLTTNKINSKLTVVKGANFTASYIRAYGAGDLELDGNVTLTGGSSNSSIYLTNGAATFGSNLKMSVAQRLEFGGKLVVDSATKSIQMGSYIAMIAGANLVLNTENAFYKNDTVGQEGIAIMTSSNAGEFYINVNANQKFDYIGFKTNATGVSSTIHLVFDSSVTEFTLNSLSNGWLRMRDVNGVIVTPNIVISGFNFENGVFYIEDWNEKDDFSLVSIEDLEYTDLRLVKDDVRGGYYITATNINAVVPEPSTYALVSALLALGFVAYRKRK